MGGDPSFNGYAYSLARISSLNRVERVLLELTGFVIPKESNEYVKDFVFEALQALHCHSPVPGTVTTFGADAGAALCAGIREKFPDALRFVCCARPHLPANVLANMRAYFGEALGKTGARACGCTGG